MAKGRKWRIGQFQAFVDKYGPREGPARFRFLKVHAACARWVRTDQNRIGAHEGTRECRDPHH